jgi:3-deoxy-manno-octulosonate cytidylyltransferase (CMP-KDO synthetase)
MNVLGIIPARYASTRFPGKPLALIAGKSMIERVYRQAEKALKTVVVATDDERIFNHIKNFGGLVVMTSENHSSGTERCAEALNLMQQKTGKTFSHVVNIQGDEPFISPEEINTLVNLLKDENVEIATLAQKINSQTALFDHNIVKVVFSHSQRAIYFSRATIPFVRGTEKEWWLEKTEFYKHVGIYAYRSDTLKTLSLLKNHAIETMESLEQNRWLANDLIIKVGFTEFESIGVDTLKDLEDIEMLIKLGKIKV